MSSEDNNSFLEAQLSTVNFAENIYKSYDHVLFRPSVNDVSAVDTIDIVAKIGSDRYTDLSKAYVECVFQLQTTADADFAAATTASAHLTNAWAAFRDLKLEIEGTQVEYVLRPGILSNMSNLKSKSSGNALSISEVEGYHPIVATDISTNALLVATNGFGSAEVYQDQTNGGIKQFTIQLKLQDAFGFCSVPKVIRGGMYTLRMTKANDWTDMLVKATASADAHLKVIRTELWMPSIQFNEELESSLAKVQTQQVPVQFDFQRSYVSRTSLTGASNVFQLNSGVSNPRMILLGFKPTANSNNSDASSYNYFHSGMNRLYARINGHILPLQPIEKNAANQHVRAYNEFLKADGKAWDETLDSLLTYTEWAQSNCIFALDCSLYNETFGSLSGPAVIQIDYQLDAALNLDVDAVVLSDSHIKLTELGGRIQIIEG